MQSITQEDHNSYNREHVSSRYICSLSRINLGIIMHEFYPAFTCVQVSAITMRANIFRFLMARSYGSFGSHGPHIWLTCFARMARTFGLHGSQVWLAWLARLAHMARTFGSLARILATLQSVVTLSFFQNLA